MKKKITTFKIFLFIFKIKNSRVVQNICPEKKTMIYENPNIFKKLVKSDGKEKFYCKKHY